MSAQNYFEVADVRRMLAEYPLGDPFMETFRRMSRDETARIVFVLLKRTWTFSNKCRPENFRMVHMCCGLK